MLKRKLVSGIAAAAVILVVAFFTILNGKTEVEYCKLQKGTMQEIVDLQGKVELDRSEKIYSRIPGTIQEYEVREGDTVKSGDLLAQIDVSDINYAIRKAEAELKGSEAKTRDLRKSIKHEKVEAAEAELRQAEAEMKAAEKDYEYKKSNSENIRLLFEKGAATKQELKDSEVLLAQAESLLESSRQSANISRYNLDMLKEGVSGDAIAELEANSEAIRVLIEEMNNNTGKAGIYSPISGVVLSRNIEKGAAVQTGEMLYEIGDYDSAYVRVDVLVDDIAKVKIGQKAVLSGDVLNGKKITGEVYYLAPRAESKVSSLGVEQQRLEVKIRFDNSECNLKPGYTMDVHIVTREKALTLYVPEKSVFELDGKHQVFVVKNNKLGLREIEKGIENDDYTEVVNGLQEGEIVVADPDNNLKNGMRVKSDSK